MIRPKSHVVHTSCLHINLQFKSTHKVNVTVNFLDLLIHQNTQRLDIGIYRKATFIDTAIHFTFNHPVEQNLAACTFLRERMLVLPITVQSKHTE